MKYTPIAISAGALMALAAQGAAAAPALAVNDVNLRQGPGTNYPIIMTIPGGSTVDVGGCQDQWCAVTWQGRSGFAIATSFDQGAGPPNSGPPPGGAGPPPNGPGGPPPSASADVPVPAYPPGAQPPPPGYYPPPPGYYPPPPGYYDPYYGPYYYGPGPYYGPYWRRRY